MTAFAGIVRFDGTFGDHESAERLALSLGAAGVAGVQTVRRGEAIFARRSKEPLHLDGHERSGLADGGNGFAALACLDNRDELRARLGLSLAGGDRIADSDLVIRIFEREGEAGIARCLGAFCFAYWDRQACRLTLARDCLGRRALFFHRGDGFIAFATTLRALLALPAVPREPDETVLANFLALNLNEARRTFYRGVERVPSRTIVTIDRSGVQHRHYWTPDLTAPPPYSRDQDYVERARELLDQAVAAAIADTPRVAISASGGLDSSAIAATVARLGRAESVTCYTLIPPTGSQLDIGPDRYWDESDKMEALGRMHPSLALRFIAPETAHPFEEDETRYFARSQVPVLNPSNFGWFSHMRDAALASGHSVILNGTRGNLGLSWRGTLSLAALLSAGEWRRFADDFRAMARESRRSLPRTFASEVLKPVAPAWLRRTLYRIARGDPDSVAHFSALNPAYIAEKGLRAQWRVENFIEPWFGATGWDARRLRAHFLFDRNQFARDTVAMHGDALGFEQREPLGDRRLLEFLLTVPEPMFRRGGVPRSFARAVLADRLPPEILNERRSGAQAGLWFTRLNARREAVAEEIERLEASPLASRMLDLPRLKRLMAVWPANDQAAETHKWDYHLALHRGLHVGRFIRWVEGGNR